MALSASHDAEEYLARKGLSFLAFFRDYCLPDVQSLYNAKPNLNFIEEQKYCNLANGFFFFLRWRLWSNDLYNVCVCVVVVVMFNRACYTSLQNAIVKCNFNLK